MRITATEYRQKAAECEAMARLMSRHDHRDHLLEIAREFLALADITAEREEAAAATVG